MTKRSVLSISGGDRVTFLQGLVTNDLARLREGPIYTALLTPQGKLIVDFFVVEDGDRLLVDVASSHAATLFQRLSLYKLRADVMLEDTGLTVSRGTGDAPEGAWTDPRDPDLGWRLIGPEDQSDATDWDALRVARMIPETGVELTTESYILEMGFERLGGVDFRKGCYVGQEVTARMKHKTDLRKGLVRVSVEGEAPPGTPIERDGREIGTLYTQSGGQALAHLRFDKAGPGMTAGSVKVTWTG